MQVMAVLRMLSLCLHSLGGSVTFIPEVNLTSGLARARPERAITEGKKGK